MRERKGNLLKVGIAIAGMLFLLAFIGRLPVADAHIMTSGLVTPGTVTVQATPTVDATVTALNKAKLQHENDWWWNYGATVLTSVISTLVLAAAGIFTVVRYFSDRRDAREKQEDEAKRLAEDRRAEREKRAEERFQAVVEGLGSKEIERQVGAAIVLRTFLQPSPDYEKFYRQTFDLAVTHLRLRPATQKPSAPLDSDEYVPPDSLSQALITVFKESYPLVRNRLNQEKSQLDIEIKSLDASHIRLDNAYLRSADLTHVQMREASLIEAELRLADLSNAYLSHANLSHANLRHVTLNGARLHHADLSHAHLRDAKLSHAYLKDANFDGARLQGADLSDADFDGEPQIEGAANLSMTNLRGVKGITEEQLAACKAKGAIIDKEPAPNPSQPASARPAPNDETQVLSPRPVKWKKSPGGPEE